MHHMEEVPYVKRVAPLQIPRELFHVLLDLRVAIRLGVRFTPAGDAFVRLDLHKQEVLARARIPEKRLDIRYFHLRCVLRLTRPRYRLDARLSANLNHCHNARLLREPTQENPSKCRS